MGSPFSIENETGFELNLSATQLALEKVCEIESIQQAVNVLLTTDQQVQELNLRFRGIDGPTDVLTFPSGQSQPFPLGDIAISLPYAQRQATARGVSLEHELIALIVHGVLHLKGYDDEQDEDKVKMQTRMNEIGEMIGTPIDAFWTSVLHREEE